MDREAARHLGKIVGDVNLRYLKSDLLDYRMDGLRPHRGFPKLPEDGYQPTAVVRPTSTLQVVEIVRLASRKHLPIIPYGAGTGLMGGAVAVRGGLVVDLTRMNRIIRISAAGRFVEAQSGVILAKLNRRLSRMGLIIGHDPWTQLMATVGGAISTNGLGFLAGKYGGIGEQVLGLEVVLPDGNVLNTRAVPKSSTGVSLKNLFIGTEGCFGIITKATLRAFPKPSFRSIKSYAFPSFDSGFKAILHLYEVGLEPHILDYGEVDWEVAAKVDVYEGTPKVEGGLLHIGYEGLRSEVTNLQQASGRSLRAQKGRMLAQRISQEFWATRHMIAEHYRESVKKGVKRFPTNTKFDFIHVALPADRVLDYKKAATSLLGRSAVDILEWGIWNEPELFSIVMICTRRDPVQAKMDMESAILQALGLAQDFGGSMEYCHGVGLRLASLMRREHGYGLDLMRKIKRTIDPAMIMNPGKLDL